jgi:hypothetical protein
LVNADCYVGASGAEQGEKAVQILPEFNRYAFNRQGCDYFTEFWRPFFLKDFRFCPLT